MPQGPTLVAVSVLDRSLVDAENLLKIHEALGTGRGRRIEEVSLNRATVVLAIAAWQAFVERLVEILLRMLEPKRQWYDGEPNRLLAATTDFHRLKGRVTDQLGRFSTPNAENTRNLLKTLGYDPRPNWRFRAGNTQYTPEDASATLGHWIRVRNHVAHGNPELPEVPVISRTVVKGTPTIHKADAKRCIRFVQELGRATETDAASRLYHPEVVIDLLVEKALRPG